MKKEMLRRHVADEPRGRCAGLILAATVVLASGLAGQERIEDIGAWTYIPVPDSFTDEVVERYISTSRVSFSDTGPWLRLGCGREDATLELDVDTWLIDEPQVRYRVRWDDDPISRDTIASLRSTGYSRVASTPGVWMERLEGSVQDSRSIIRVPRDEWDWLFEGMRTHRRLRIRFERERFGPLDVSIIVTGFADAIKRLPCF